jgi:hypothetical protein
VRKRLQVFGTFKDELLRYYKDMQQDIANFPLPEGGPDAVFAAFRKLL